MMLFLAVALAGAPPSLCDSQLNDDIIKCAQNQFAAADADLNRIWKKLRKYPELVRAQRLWLEFRKLDCEVRNPATPEGRLYPAFKSGCLAELTKRRVEDLRELSER